jgi:hypothetical protein
MERCELSDLPADQCGCRVHRPGQAVDARPVQMAIVGFGPAVAAQYRGMCGLCHDQIVPGEHIRRERLRPLGSSGVGTDGDWAHDQCATGVITTW